jgi:hypothetical protein
MKHVNAESAFLALVAAPVTAFVLQCLVILFAGGAQ